MEQPPAHGSPRHPLFCVLVWARGVGRTRSQTAGALRTRTFDNGSKPLSCSTVSETRRRTATVRFVGHALIIFFLFFSQRST